MEMGGYALWGSRCEEDIRTRIGANEGERPKTKTTWYLEMDRSAPLTFRVAMAERNDATGAGPSELGLPFGPAPATQSSESVQCPL
jgi:hypothetical protein